MSFIKSSSLMFFGTIVSQVIAVLSLPILAQLYSPEEIGFFTTTLAYISVIGLTASLKLERKLFEKSSASSKKERVNICRTISFISALMLTSTIWFLIELNFIVYDDSYILYIFVIGYLVSLIQIESVYLSSENKFSHIAKSTVLRSSLLIVSQIAIYYVLPAKHSLLVGGGVSTLICFLYLKNSQFSLDVIKLKNFITEKENRNEGIFGGCHSLLSSISINAPIMIISSLAGLHFAGLYAISEKLVKAPINLISNNLRPVIQRELTDKNIVDTKRFLFKVSFIMFTLAMIFSLIISTFSSWFFEVFLPKSWFDASVYFSIIIFILPFNFLAVPYQSYNVINVNMQALAFLELVVLVIKTSLMVSCFTLNFSFKYVCLALVVSSLVMAIFQVVIFKLNTVKKN